MNEYEMLANEMTAMAAEDFIEGFKSCAKQYGLAFLAEGWAVKLPDSENPAADVNRYAVAATGKKLPHSMCLFFDARDYFLGSMFTGIYNLSGEKFVERLTEKAKHAVRDRRHCSKRTLVDEVLIDAEGAVA